MATVPEFIAYNETAFQQLLRFFDFAPERLTIAFVSVNFTPDRDTLIEAIKDSRCVDCQLVVLDFPDPDLQFFQEALLEKLAKKLAKEKRQPNKKLVLLITRLEESIELAGDYPYVLQDLNYVRDSFSDKVPYPLVFFLPDYAITRLAKFAPDFWAWQLGIFEFHTPPEGEPTQETIDPKILQQQLDELQKLLEKHSHTQRTTTLTTQKIYAQITRLYRNLGQENADPVFRTVLQLPPLMPRQVDILRWWGTLKRDSGHTDESLKLYQQALEIEAKIKDDRNEARTLQELAVLYNDRKDFERAQKLIQNALEIHRKLGDTNVQAKQFLESLEKSKKAIGLEQSAYREAQKGNTQKAIELYTELLDLYEELGNPDRLVIARTNDSLAELLDQIDAKLQTPLSWRDRIFSRGHP